MKKIKSTLHYIYNFDTLEKCDKDRGIDMKKKNGFTLIELLAIIVILAIIAVITVPIILNIIDNSKKGAATNSALGYKDAVQKFYAEELVLNRAMSLDGTYTIEDGKLTGIFNGTEETKDIPISGTKPTSGTLVYEDNVLKTGCIVVGEYATSFLNGKADQTVKGTCENGALLASAGNPNSGDSGKKGGSQNNEPAKSIILTSDNDKDGEVSTADYVKIGDDGFYVVAGPIDGNYLLSAEYNLDSNSRQNATSYLNIAFSNSVSTSGCSYECSYWYNYSAQALKSNYLHADNAYFEENYGYTDREKQLIAYIYRDKDGNDTANNVKTYINNYREYLEQTANIVDVRIISYEETVMAGCTRDNNANSTSCPAWLANQTYWTGSQTSGWDYQLYVHNNDWDGPNSYSSPSCHQSVVIGQTTSQQYGIRPLVVVAASEIGR